MFTSRGFRNIPRCCLAVVLLTALMGSAYGQGSRKTGLNARDSKPHRDVAASALKLPVPDASSIAKAAQLVKELYKDEYDAATSADGQAKLAYQLVGKAGEMADDSTSCYALLREAASLASKAAAYAVNFEIIDQMDARFTIDACSLQAEVLAAADRDAKAPAKMRYALGVQLIARAMMENRFDLAAQMGNLTQRAAEQSKDKEQIKLMEKANAKLEKLSQTMASQQELAARLEASPTDPEANIALGELYCFEQGNWEKGIPMLALVKDAELKSLAEKELAAPTTTEDHLQLAEGWWTLAQTQKEPAKSAMTARAGYWYRLVLPNLTGLRKEKTAKRLAAMPVQASHNKAIVFDLPTGYARRGTGARAIAVATDGGTMASERAVAAALNWLARHQMPNGSWSIGKFPTRCGGSGGPCSGAGESTQETGATAMAILPFLAAGQTHVSKGPYQKNIGAGIHWLRSQQKADGDLRGKDGSMYSHGLATIALCDAYGISGDKSVGACAQKAVNFIQTAQNTTTGGWRYTPGEEGDTSVVGWQLMALKAAHMAKLAVNPAALDKTKVWLKSCAKGYHGEQFSYTPAEGGTSAMTAVGLLCQQYLGAKRDDPMMTSGATYLMANLPDMNQRNIYYWYYATQAMHNIQGPQWDAWNQKMRTTLTDSQDKDGCASGSWNPDKPNADAWGRPGGRVMMTALSALTLEIYYRYTPAYEE